jgi:transposase-like protein
VAIAALKGDKTIAELSQQFDIHANQVIEWKKQLLENSNQIFRNKADSKDLSEGDLKDLNAKIGQLTLENDFLTKVLER